MRKALVTGLAAAVLSVVFAAPALALKDPFEPLVTTEDQSSTTTGTNGTTTDVDEPTVVNGNPFSDGVPETGADTSSWLVISYLLVVCGAATLVLARTLHPTTPAHRQDFRS